MSKKNKKIIKFLTSSALAAGCLSFVSTSLTNCSIHQVDVTKVVDLVIDETTRNLNAGKSFKIIGIIKFADGSIEEVDSNNAMFSSMNSSVASVDENGMVECISRGSTIITVTSKQDTNFVSSFTLNVFKIVLATDLIVDESTKNLYKNETFQVTGTVEFSDGSTELISSENATFSSDDTNIASVDEDGLVTCKNVGTSTITIVSKDNPILVRNFILNVLKIVEGESLVYYMDEQNNIQTINLVLSDLDVLNLPVGSSSSLEYVYEFAEKNIMRKQLVGIVFGDEEFSGVTDLSPYNAFLWSFFLESKQETIIADLSGLRNVTKVGTSFLSSMFKDCKNLKYISGFNMPSEIQNVGNTFARRTFYGCSSLTNLPNNFNFPQNITGNVGEYFASEMFEGCTQLTSLPKGFNLPQSIGAITNNFADSMFEDCVNLKSLPDDFNLPQSLEMVGLSFVFEMFRGCKSLVSLPNGFNLPQDVTIVGDKFAQSMFNECENLSCLPEGFNLPQNIDGDVGSEFVHRMFQQCKNLQALPAGFTFPQNITDVGEHFADLMFDGCRTITDLPEGFNLPQSIVNIDNHFLDNMFHNCVYLRVLPDGFNLPQNINVIRISFCDNMFYGCYSLETLPHDFNFPQPPTLTEVDGRTFASNMFYGCANLLYDFSESEPLVFPNIWPIKGLNTYAYNCFLGADKLTSDNKVKTGQESNPIPPGYEVYILRN